MAFYIVFCLHGRVISKPIRDRGTYLRVAEFPPILFVAFFHMFHQRFAATLTVLVLVENGTLDLGDFILGKFFLQVTRKFLGRFLQKYLFNLEGDNSSNPYLKVLLVRFEYFLLVVLPQIVGEHVRVHERSATTAERRDCVIEKLNFHPRHRIVLL